MNTLIAKHQNRRRLKSQAGFTLIEIGIVLVIVGILAAIAIPSISYYTKQGRISGTVSTIKMAKTFVAEIHKSAGTIPQTEGAVSPPVTGAALVAQAAAAKAAASRLDLVAVSLGVTDKLLTVPMGTKVVTPAGSGADLVWNQKFQAFMMDDPLVPGSPSATLTALRDWSNVSRLESVLSAPATVPSAANGANFRLNGTTNTVPNTIVTYFVIKNCDYKDALALAKEVNGTDLTTATEAGSAQDNGEVVFAAPVGGVTDVYVYVSTI